MGSLKAEEYFTQLLGKEEIRFGAWEVLNVRGVLHCWDGQAVGHWPAGSSEWFLATSKAKETCVSLLQDAKFC